MLKSGRGGAGGGSLVSHVLTIGRLNALGINNTAPFQSVFSQDSPISLRFSPAIFCRGASSARLHGMNRSNVQLCWFKFTRFRATETSILSRTELTKSVLSIWNARSTIILYQVLCGMGAYILQFVPTFVLLRIKHIVMVYYMDAITEIGRNPPSKRHIQPEYGAGWRKTGRPNLSR